MAWMLLLAFTTLPPAPCALRVSQPPEVRAQEGATVLLPCSFNASSGTAAIGSVTWYRDTVAPGKEVRNGTLEFRGRLAPLASSRFLRDHQAELRIWDARGGDAGLYVCRVQVLGLGVGTGNGTLLVVETGPPGTGALTALLLRAGFCAFSFLSVAVGSTIYYHSRTPQCAPLWVLGMSKEELPSNCAWTSRPSAWGSAGSDPAPPAQEAEAVLGN
ncbi:unnamed protein product, partial [Pipistrellus nathusii]